MELIAFVQKALPRGTVQFFDDTLPMTFRKTSSGTHVYSVAFNTLTQYPCFTALYNPKTQIIFDVLITEIFNPRWFALLDALAAALGAKQAILVDNVPRCIGQQTYVNFTGSYLLENNTAVSFYEKHGFVPHGCDDMTFEVAAREELLALTVDDAVQVDLERKLLRIELNRQDTLDGALAFGLGVNCSQKFADDKQALQREADALAFQLKSVERQTLPLAYAQSTFAQKQLLAALLMRLIAYTPTLVKNYTV